MLLNSDSSYMSLCRNSYCINSILTHIFDSGDCTVINSDASMLINCSNCQVINSPHTRLTNCRNVSIINSRFVNLLNQSNQVINGDSQIANIQPRRPRLVNTRLRISDLRNVRRMTVNEDSECSVCQDQIGERLGVMLECDHIFHETCIVTWINSPRSNALTCPNCRQLIRTLR